MSDRYSKSILCLKSVSLQATVGSDFLLQNVSCDFLQGQKVGVIGASGSGKTSLLRLINRLVSPNDGEILLGDGLDKNLTTTQLRQQIVLVPQEPKLLGMKASDALAYPLRLQQLSESKIRQKIDTWIDLLNIQEKWLSKTELQLSLGQRQLIAIARGLVMQPQILLLDEPTSALDIGTAARVRKVLEDLNQSQDLTIILVNHQLELIKNFCDRLLFLDSGKLAEDLLANDSHWEMLQQRLMRSHSAEEEEWS